MPAAEPHPRRRVACRRARSFAAATVLLLGVANPASASPGQLLPTTTTEPAPTTTTTVPEPVETTTTTEAAPATTTTAVRRTTTTSRSPITSASSDEADDRQDAEGAGNDPGTDGAGGELDRVAEDEPTETTTTARDLLVEGDGTVGSESTTTTSTTVVEVAADDGALDEETQIWLIVAGLVVVAVLIGVWTWRYWRRTRPEQVEQAPDPTTVFPSG